MKICVNCIATNNYIEFVPQLIQSIDKYFLVNHEVVINLFTDGKLPLIATRLKIIQHKIPAYGWPDATLRRYEIMTGIEYDCDYIFYLDADMKIVDYVGDEILGDLVAVRHPGYFVEKGSGSWETREESACYVPEPLRVRYYAGGINGGKKHTFIYCMNQMKDWIQADLDKGIIPIWHDESALNCMLAFLSLVVADDNPNLTELNPSYCMPEAKQKRIKWGINDLPPKILALEKDLNHFR